MKFFSFIATALFLTFVSSCSLLNSAMKLPTSAMQLPASVMQTLGRTAGVVRLTDEAPDPIFESDTEPAPKDVQDFSDVSERGVDGSE